MVSRFMVRGSRFVGGGFSSHGFSSSFGTVRVFVWFIRWLEARLTCDLVVVNSVPVSWV